LTRLFVSALVAVSIAHPYTRSVRLRPDQPDPNNASVSEIARLFLDPPADSRIMMRWWWFGPSATRDELDAEMRHMKDGGIGGFEVATVYPLAVDDPASGFHNYPYLSAEFLDKIAYTSRRARELGLRMDLTIGSGWSYGGPYITPNLAATRIRSERREIAPGVTSLARPDPFEHDTLIAAFIGLGSVQEADPASFRALEIPERGPIALPAGTGPRVVLFYFAGQTGQVVKRVADGAEGYVLDHYNRDAIETHLREAGDKLLAAADPGSIDSVFCDSLEVYDADWTADLFHEFEARRGYDLRPLLPIAELGTGGRADAVRRDYGRTLTELFEDRFLVPMHEWAAKNHVRFRIQNYGLPPATLASYRHADVFDGEGFQWRTLSATRWASSASHLFGRPVTSSETWTWLHSPAFRATPIDLKAEADLHFLSGINQLIGHGWPYSAPQASAPGWMFYAAGVYSDKNPWWPVMPDTSRYLQRVSFLLRQGDPVADVALYAPTDDAWSMIRPGSGRNLNLWSGIRDLIGPSIVPAILDAGHAFDLIDDETMKEAQARRYRLIVLPTVKLMPDATRLWLAEYAAGGGKVLDAGKGDDLQARIAAALPADVALDPPVPAIGFVHRRLRDADVYFLANTSNVARTERARFGDRTENVELWDPLTGGIEQPRASGNGLMLTFEPHGSRIVVFRKSVSTAPRSIARRAIGSAELRTGWTVTAGSAARSATVDLPHSWADDPNSRYFSGTAVYRRAVQVPASFRAAGTRVFLDFGAAASVDREALPGGTMRGNSFAALIAPPIREAATVFVNGQRAGSIWAPPYRVDVTALLRDGSNDIRIEVYNTAINQLAEGGRLPDVAAVTERYGQRFRLQDVDHIQPIPSGILSVPRLVAER
jgi:alpha-L-rhamnosidase